ncbi:MAG TPA: biotin/lipoyl-binding protein, partial [Myxococcales bacterium]|nr:biotin/lipoyl-binding protein [Myxococcales bacterium]
MRSFEADSFRAHGVVLVLAIAVLAGWLSWSFLARVSVVQVTSSGRVESVRAVHQVDSPVEGQVVRAPRQLGDAVEAGDLLVELDSRPLQIELARTRAQEQTQRSELELLRQQIDQEREAQQVAGTADRAALKEAVARREELVPKLELSEQRSLLAEAAPNGAVSPIEALERKSDAESVRRSAQSSSQALARLTADQALSRRRRELHLQELRRDAVELDSRPLQIELARTRAQEQTQRSELELLRQQIVQEREAQQVAGTADRAARQEAVARREELVPKLELSEQRSLLAEAAPNGAV